MLTPPDQGLCVGRDPTLRATRRPSSSRSTRRLRETTPGGALLLPDVGLATLFSDPFAEGDVRCLYDQQTQSFYFTEIGFPVATGPWSDDNNTTVDVAGHERNGVASYQFDTSLGGRGDCFGDQPKTGFNNNALVISTDEYCGPTESNYEGAIALAISKSQLVAEAATVNDSVSARVPGRQPGRRPGPGDRHRQRTGYLVNSVPFLANGNNNPVGDTLGLWTLTNSAAVTTGPGTPALTSRCCPASRTRSRCLPRAPATARSPRRRHGHHLRDRPQPRRQPAQRAGRSPAASAAGSSCGPRWTPRWSPGRQHRRDGAAWFRIDATSRASPSGYVTARGAYLLYPASGRRSRNPGEVFTITSKTSTRARPTPCWAPTGSSRWPGTSAHVSFSDARLSTRLAGVTTRSRRWTPGARGLAGHQVHPAAGLSGSRWTTGERTCSR